MKTRGLLLLAVIAFVLFCPSYTRRAKGAIVPDGLLHAMPQAGSGCGTGIAHCVILTWDASPTDGQHSAATSYQVLRGTASGQESTTPIGTVAAPTTTYTDTTGIGGVKYFYEVVAVNSAGSSGPSNEASATFLVSPPNPVTGLVAASD